MQVKAILAAATLAGLTAASPLKPRQMPADACGTERGSFTLQAVAQNGTTYPLATGFAAEFGQTLRLVANPATPFNPTAITESHIGSDASTGYVFSTPHATQVNPNGGPVQFNSTVPAAGAVVSMANPVDGAPGFSKLCGDLVNNPTYYTLSGSVYDFTLCDGDAVDKYLGRRLVYYQGTDASCVNVALQLVQ